MTKTMPIRSLAVAVCLAYASPAISQDSPAQPDGPLARAVELARDADVRMRYAYTRRVIVDSDDAHIDRLARFDPRHAEGARWTLLEVDGAAPSAADLEEYDPDETGDFGGSEAFDLYRDMVEDIDIGDAVLTERTSETAVYRLRETDPGFLNGENEDFAEYLTTRLTVDTGGAEPYLRSFDIGADRPFEPSMIADIDRFELNFGFMQHPETGDILPEAVVVGISIDALVFFSVDADTRVTFSDYEPVDAR